MLKRHSSQLYAETRHGVSGEGASPGYTPRHNHLLALLPLQEYEQLLSDLEPVALPPGKVVYGAGDREDHLYFLAGGTVCRFCRTDSGKSTEFAVTGSEGVIGIASFLGGISMPSEAMVLAAGYAYRLRAKRLQAEFERDGPLQRLLLRYTLSLITQTAQTAVCNRYHTLEQQLCRWILSCLDRAPANELTMTQELIANMLGVRREGVTEVAGRLQQAGMIHYSRGRMTVLDRPQLEVRVCECYSVVKKETDRLFPDYQQLGTDRVHGSGLDYQCRENRRISGLPLASARVLVAA